MEDYSLYQIGLTWLVLIILKCSTKIGKRMLEIELFVFVTVLTYLMLATMAILIFREICRYKYGGDGDKFVSAQAYENIWATLLLPITHPYWSLAGEWLVWAVAQRDESWKRFQELTQPRTRNQLPTKQKLNQNPTNHNANEKSRDLTTATTKHGLHEEV